ncbi:hypothetical protein Tco_0933533 [Tanacetum coccineum]
MAFRNLMYAETDEDLSFLRKEPSLDFGRFEGSSRQGEFVIHLDVCSCKIKVKCKTGGSPRPYVKHKLAQGASSSCATCAKTTSSKDDSLMLTISDDDKGLPDVLEVQNANACHLKIFTITPPAWKNQLDNHLDVELLDLHD